MSAPAKRPRFGRTKRAFLSMLEGGPKLACQFTDYNAIRDLCHAGLVERCYHPTVKSGQYPADAYRLTDKARQWSWND